MSRPKARFCRYCNKNSYTQMGAISAAMAQSQKNGVSLRIYHCPHKGGYHLTRKVRPAKGNVHGSPSNQG